VLMEYPGTLIVVSHDRYFLKGLANRVFSLTGDGRLQIFEASFDAYLDLKNKSDPLEHSIGQTKEQEEKLQRQQQHRKRQQQQKEERRLKSLQFKLEQKITEQEEKIVALEATLSNPERYGDHTQLARLGAELETARSELDDLLEKWEDLATRLITEHP